MLEGKGTSLSNPEGMKEGSLLRISDLLPLNSTLLGHFLLLLFFL
jgi:hypothetical protein